MKKKRRKDAGIKDGASKAKKPREKAEPSAGSGPQLGENTDYDVYEMKPDERKRVLLLSVLSSSLCGYLYFHSLPVSAAFALFSFAIVPIYKKMRAEQQKHELRIEFRDFLYSVSASVNTGRNLEEALADACGPLSLIYGEESNIVRELSRMSRVIQDANGSAELLLRDLARRSHIEEIEEFVDVCATCRTTGGDLSALIGKASEIITQNIELAREKHVLLSQKKLESRILALMPPSVILLINMSSSDYLNVLYTTVEGRLIMAASLAASLGSFLWSFRLISFN